VENLDLALWDTNDRRAIALKDRLDMFAGDRGATLIQIVPQHPIRAHDAVFLSFDECGELPMKIARKIRKSSEMTFILLVNDRTRDLSPFFRPMIRPSGVLYRPVQNIKIRELLEEITAELERLSEDNIDDLFVFKAEGMVRRIAYSDILFFEASSKKIVMHTKGQEISYYGSIENLSASLPPYFFRCHRSYIVNTRKIRDLYGADMELRLVGGERIPFSRSYRDQVKQVICGQATPIYSGQEK